MARPGRVSDIINRFERSVSPPTHRPPLGSHSLGAVRPPTTPCDICSNCGQRPPEQRCDACDRFLCEECDDLWHKHPSRRRHERRPCQADPVFQLDLQPQSAFSAFTEAPASTPASAPAAIPATLPSDWSMPAESSLYQTNISVISESMLNSFVLPERSVAPAAVPDVSDWSVFEGAQVVDMATASPPSPRESFAERIASGAQTISEFIDEVKEEEGSDGQRKHRAAVARAELERFKDQVDAEAKTLMQMNVAFDDDDAFERLTQSSKRLQLAIAMLKELVRKLDASSFSRLPVSPSAPPPPAHVEATPPLFHRDDAWEAQPAAAQRLEAGGGDAGGAMEEQWECEHCTIHNPCTTRICSMCYKTSDNPRKVPTTPSVTVDSAIRPAAGVSVTDGSEFGATGSVMADAQNSPTGGAADVNHGRSFMATSIFEEQDEIYLQKVPK